MDKEKKEIWKLLELLNEYEDPMVSWYDEYVEEFWMFMPNNKEQGIAEEIVISKSYGFIQRLVEQDKIDRDKMLKDSWKIRITYFGLWPANYLEYEKLLMLLSIQENPISFLISILK